jgi:Lrp/AsnC family transcriptional regulator for asnA, asnC and gidA
MSDRRARTQSPAPEARGGKRERGAPAARAPAARPAPAPPAHLDDDAELNWKIVSLLQEDGRMPFSTIAEKVGVSEGTVRNRVNQLREQNVMQIAAEVLPQAFGYTWNSVVFLKLSGGADLEDVARRLAEIPEVYYVVQMTGSHDLAITSFHRDREHFRAFLNQHFYGRPDILSVEANVNLKVFKMKLKWQVMALEGG